MARRRAPAMVTFAAGPVVIGGTGRAFDRVRWSKEGSAGAEFVQNVVTRVQTRGSRAPSLRGSSHGARPGQGQADEGRS